ncbi:MAG TPA: VOC family protein [Pyrinomonadaceae bacterium]|nr:VOC family protein [Pyrinomonadaceae bacterium]
MPKVTPFLWFDKNAEEAANFYVSIFKNSRVGKISRSGDALPGPKGSVLTVEFELDGEKFVALNGGPQFKFTEAVSFVVNCESQEEIDYFWEKLSEGGEKSQCGWLKDKYGLSWQVWPGVIGDFLAGDPEGSNRVMQEVMKMQKLEIEPLQRAYEGRG